MTSFEQYIARLITAPPTGCRLHSHLTLSARQSAGVSLPATYPHWLSALLQTQGIQRLAAYQGEALQSWQQGEHLCVSAPTGGGRGLVRLLALYNSLSPTPEGHALLIFPHKSRELAQLAKLTTWNEQLPAPYRLSAAIYDGDTPQSQRRSMRLSPPRLLLTTPEMLHAGMLAYHAGWRGFFQHLRAVILVDVHLCAGALGAHMTHLLARVQRLSSHYGSQPQYLMTSAPVANLPDVARRLIGQPCAVVEGEAFQSHVQSQIVVAACRDNRTVLHHLCTDLQTIAAPPLVLVPTGIVWDDTVPALQAEGRVLVCQTPVSPAAYQAAEQQLLQGASSALILPYDTPTAVVRPTGIRSVIFLGLPSSLTLLHDYLALFTTSHPQSLSLLVLTDATPLERYVLRYLAVYHTTWLQEPGFQPQNPQVAQHHLLCAAAELALAAGEPYTKKLGMQQFIEHLAATSALVRRTATGDWITTQPQIHRRVRLRAYEPPFVMVHELDGQLLTRLPPGQAFRDGFAGATLAHGKRLFHVERILPERRRLIVRPSYTMSPTRGILTTRIEGRHLEAALSKDTFRLSTGGLTIIETLQVYERLDPQTHLRTSIHALSTHQRQLHTQGTWLNILIPGSSLHCPAQTAVHTLTHALLAGLSLLWLDDAISIRATFLDSENTENMPEVVVFDESAGGNGASGFLYRRHLQVLRLALQILLQCDCEHACPRCSAGSTCGACTQEVPLDRQAGITLLQRLLGEVAPGLEHVRLPAGATTMLTQESHKPRHVYLCLTTQKSADEVGGWQHKHLLGLGVAVTYATHDGQYRAYTAEAVEDLLASLCQADLVIGFNLHDFDYQVLQPYTITSLAALPTLAILDEVQQGLGYRLSFSHLLQETLGIDRPDESLQTLQWFRQGDRDRIVQYCRRDIAYLRALMQHGAHTGRIMYRDRADARQALAVHWQLAQDDG